MPFSDIEAPSHRQKALQTPQILTRLTSECASRHNGVHFFHISTSKSRPRPTCFDTFYFQMCFAPQDTRTCTFSTSQRPKMVRTWCALYMFTSKRASRHNGVHFFDISTSKSGPELRCFVDFDLKCVSYRNGVHFFDISTSKTAPKSSVFVTLYFQLCFATVAWNLSTRHLASWLRTRRFSEPAF